MPAPVFRRWRAFYHRADGFIPRRKPAITSSALSSISTLNSATVNFFCHRSPLRIQPEDDAICIGRRCSGAMV